MSRIELIKGSSVEQDVDAIVNAANRYLMAGSGVCGAIFKAAGYDELTEACKEYELPLNDGDAVITPAFNISNTKYIIHAVGPDFNHKPDGFEELYKAYYNSLKVLKENNLHSISFPLISSGIYGGRLEDPVGVSTKECLRAYNDFIKENKDYDITVLLCCYTEEEKKNASIVFNK